MTDVGDAIELTYSTAPSASVTMSWIHLPTDTVLLDNVPVSETLGEGGAHTGLFPVTLVGPIAGMYEAIFTATGTATNTESYYEKFDSVGGLPPLATLGEYTDLYGSLGAARAATARALLKRASQLVRDTYPGIDDRIVAGTVSADSAGLAVLNMVVRVMRNPGGLRSETTGPFSRAYDPDAASGMLQLDASDIGLLVPPGGTGMRGRVRSARITGGMVPGSCTTNWPGRGLVYGPET